MNTPTYLLEWNYRLDRLKAVSWNNSLIFSLKRPQIYKLRTVNNTLATFGFCVCLESIFVLSLACEKTVVKHQELHQPQVNSFVLSLMFCLLTYFAIFLWFLSYAWRFYKISRISRKQILNVDLLRKVLPVNSFVLRTKNSGILIRK